MRQLACVFIMATALASATVANATIVSQTYNITASGFTPNGGATETAPYDPVNLNFTLTFNDSADIAATTAGLTVNSFNLPYSVEYSYSAQYDILTIGTSVNGVSFQEARNTFGDFIGSASTATPTDGYGFEYEIADGTSYNAAAATITATPSGGGGGPEPSTWALMMVGIFGAGLALRRRKDRAVALAA